MRTRYAMDEKFSDELCSFCWQEQNVPVSSVEVCNNEYHPHTMHITCLRKVAKKYTKCPLCSYKLSRQTLNALNIRLPNAQASILTLFLAERERLYYRVHLRCLAFAAFTTGVLCLTHHMSEGETVQPITVCMLLGGICGIFYR